MNTPFQNMHDGDMKITGSDAELYEEALREIECHIRSKKFPISHIIGTLKRVLPEYND